MDVYGIPGLYVTGDPGAKDSDAKDGIFTDLNWVRVGESTPFCHRPDTNDAMPSVADECDFEWMGIDCQNGELDRGAFK